MLFFHTSLTKKISYLFLPLVVILAVLIRACTRLKVRRINSFCNSYREKTSQIPNNFHSEGEEGLMILFKLLALINRKKNTSFLRQKSLDSLYTIW